METSAEDKDNTNNPLFIGGRRGALTVGFASVGTAGLSFLTQILFERSLGTQGFAQWSFFSSLCVLLITVSCLGAGNLILSKYFSGHLHANRGLLQLLAYFAVCCALGILGFVGVYVRTRASNEALLPCFPLELLTFVAQVPIVLVYPVFQFRAQYHQMAFWPFIQNLNRFIVALLIFAISATYANAVALWTLFSLGLAAWAIRLCWKSLRKRLYKITLKDMREMLSYREFMGVAKSGATFGAVEALDSLDLKLIVPLTGLAFGSGEISAMALGVLLLFAIYFFPYVLVSNLLLPTIHRLSDSDPRPLSDLVVRISLYSIVALVPVSILLYFFGYSALATVVKGDYSAHQEIFRVIGLAVIPLTLSILCAAPLIPRQHTHKLLRLRIESILVFFGTSLFLLFFQHLGAISFVWGIIVDRIYLITRCLIQVRRVKLPASEETASSSTPHGTIHPLPPATIVVPCRNEAPFIKQCLESICTNDYPAGKLEVLVVDGMSTDGTRAIVEDYCRRKDNIRLINNPRGITPCALNIGVTQATGEVILWMSAHNVYQADYVTQCVTSLEKYGADNVGGIIVALPRNDTIIGQAVAIAISQPFGVGNSYFRSNPREPKWVDTVFGGCYRKSVFKRIGFFNEELVRGQDLEFNLRLREAGGKILLVPSISSNYFARSDLKSFWKHSWTNGIWAILPFRKSRVVPVSFRHIVPLLFITSLFFSLALSWWEPARYILACILISYTSFNLGATICAARMIRRTRIAIFLPLTFSTLHFAYGLGSFWGLILIAKDLFSRKRGFDLKRPKTEIN